MIREGRLWYDLKS